MILDALSDFLFDCGSPTRALIRCFGGRTRAGTLPEALYAKAGKAECCLVVTINTIPKSMYNLERSGEKASRIEVRIMRWLMGFMLQTY